MTTLRYGTVNAKGRLAPIRFMLRKRQGRRPTGLAVSEGVRGASVYLAGLGRWHVLRHLGGRDDVRAGKDVQVLVQGHHDITLNLTVRASEASEPIKIAPDRNLVVVGHETPLGPVALVGVHPHAVTTDRNVRVDRVRETAELVQTLKRVIVWLRREGYHVVVLGDSNWRRGAESLDWQDISEMFDQIDMAYDFHGLEVAAWSKGLRRTRVQVFERYRKLTGHPSLLHDFRAAR